MKLLFSNEWLRKHANDPEPEGCPACGALAGCCSKYPNCPGNPEWKPGPDSLRERLRAASDRVVRLFREV